MTLAQQDTARREAIIDSLRADILERMPPFQHGKLRKFEALIREQMQGERMRVEAKGSEVEA